MPGILTAIEPAARLTVAVLFNSLWESAVLAVAVWAILRAFPNLNATTRYAAWCVALAASLLLPVATAIPQISVQHQAAVTAASVALPAPARRSRQTPIAANRAVKTAPASAVSAPAVQSFRLPDRIRVALPEYVALALFAAWILASLLLLVRLGFNLYRLERLKSDALPLPVDYRERLAQWNTAEKGDRDVRLCICEGIDVPVAVGLFDSMILIPRHLLETLSPDEMDQIMLHELGHLRRADDWTNGAQRVIQALFFFNPAVIFIAQQLDLEREVACDDWVLRQTKSVRPYATCLTKMAEVTAWPHRPLAAPGVFITRRGLSLRVERLLRAGRNIRTSLSFGPAGAVVAALVVMFFVLQSVAPTFAFTLPAQEQRAMHVAALTAAPSPKPSAKPAAAAVARPDPRETTLIVPGVHVHVPAQTVHIPAVNVDVPEQRIHMVRPSIPPVPPTAYFPKDFGKQIKAQIDQAMSAGMQGFVSGKPGARGGMNCVGCDYSHQNLAGKSFRGQRLSGADFSHANLQNADFSNSGLLGADFTGANLRGANFSHAQLTGCDLTHADLTGVNFGGATMIGCDVDARSLTSAQARDLLHACTSGCDFSGANLSGQDLRGIHVTGVDLSGADLRGADLSGSTFSGVDFSGAKLDGARFNNTVLTGCNFDGVNLSGVDLSGAKMTGDKLTPRQR